MDTNITRYDHTTATDYQYGDTTQEYMALMEPTFLWVYPEPIHGDHGNIVGSEWYAVHSFSNNLGQVSNLLSDICIGADREEYAFDLLDLVDDMAINAPDIDLFPNLRKLLAVEAEDVMTEDPNSPF